MARNDKSGIPVLLSREEALAFAADKLDNLRLDLTLAEILLDPRVLSAAFQQIDFPPEKLATIARMTDSLKNPELQKNALRSASQSIRNLYHADKESHSESESLLLAALSQLERLESHCPEELRTSNTDIITAARRYFKTGDKKDV